MVDASSTGTLILLVDDQTMIRIFLRAALEKHGYRVVETGDAEALAVFEEHQANVSLLLTDVVMPRKNGVELAKQVIGYRPNLPIVFISAYCDSIPNELRRYRCIAKPFTPVQVIDQIGKNVGLEWRDEFREVTARLSTLVLY